MNGEESVHVNHSNADAILIAEKEKKLICSKNKGFKQVNKFTNNIDHRPRVRRDKKSIRVSLQ